MESSKAEQGTPSTVSVRSKIFNSELTSGSGAALHWRGLNMALKSRARDTIDCQCKEQLAVSLPPVAVPPSTGGVSTWPSKAEQGTPSTVSVRSN